MNVLEFIAQKETQLELINKHLTKFFIHFLPFQMHANLTNVASLISNITDISVIRYLIDVNWYLNKTCFSFLDNMYLKLS